MLGADSDTVAPAYMAEVNLGITGFTASAERLRDAVRYFSDRLDQGRYTQGSLLYSIGNCFSALGQEENAKVHYEAALADRAVKQEPDLASQVHKNLGTSFERLGDEESAVEHYHEALRLNPHLAEAHDALAQFNIRRGEWTQALKHLDEAVFTDPNRSKSASIAGWRANVLFNMGDGTAAFRQINSLLSQADEEVWIWPFFARLVANFGRSTPENARHALAFWRRFLVAFPENSHGNRELLLASLYLQSQGLNIGRTYVEFRAEFEQRIGHIADAEETGFLWDRLGHWAQDQLDWVAAEFCFRKAYELAGGHYGYCLGTALNFLSRYEESLPILREQAERIQPDAMSWFQLGVSNAELGNTAEAIAAYERALALDPNYDHALFNLGGAHWNSGQIPSAIAVWNRAISRYPDHQLTSRLRRDMPQLFPEPEVGPSKDK